MTANGNPKGKAHPQKKKDATVGVNQAILYAAIFFIAGYVLSALIGGFNFTGSDSQKLTASEPEGIPQAPVDQTVNIIASLLKEANDAPNSAEKWANLGNAYFDAGSHFEAIDAYKKSLDLDSTNANVWTDMGIMFRRTSRPTEAIEAFDKAREADATHEMSRFNKGIVLYYDFDDKTNAIKAWEEVKALNPNFITPNGQSITQAIANLE